MIIVTGQTATGKTSYAYNLAKEVNGELINADARQIYKHLDIVTGKERFEDVHTWLLDIVDPKEPFSSAEFAQKAREAIREIEKKGKTPIIVGGSYLYLKNLLYGFETDSIPPDWELRKELESLSVQALQQRIGENTLNNSDFNNPRRLMRKIEIAEYLQNNPSHLTTSNETVPNIEKYIGLRFENSEKMKEKISKRVQERIDRGAVQETEELLKNGYKKSDPGLQTIGYKQIISYLEKEISEEEMISLWITAEVQYAKRQYTFMKQDHQISWCIAL